MRNRRKLAELLKLSENYFSQAQNYGYREFTRPKPNGDGERKFIVPQDELKDIQKCICKLLNRIETPEWVMSGKKSCSYITNAEVHCENKFVKTMDISKFYDSAQRSKIYNMFLETFRMEHDIAWLMTELVTYKGILPTGSPSSQLIIYWAYRDMFFEIKELADIAGCEFSLYVDDMTFSSDMPIRLGLRESVANVLKRYGLRAKVKKDHYYQAKDFKIVTGVGIRRGKKIVPNKKRRQVIELYKKCRASENIYDIEKLNGTLCSLKQIEPNIFPEIDSFVRHYDLELRKLSKDRFYESRRRKYSHRLKETNSRG